MILKKVIIIQNYIPQYRVDFFNQLRESLKTRGILLEVYAGQGSNSDRLKKDFVPIVWVKYIKNMYLFGDKLIYQPCFLKALSADLVIVEHAGKLLLNYLLVLTRGLKRIKLAFWIHGKNMQINPNGLKNRFKAIFFKGSDWWFAYTEGIKQYLLKKGYPANKITALQNAFDTRCLKGFYKSITSCEINKIREETGLYTENIGIYCGGMYTEKRLGFILEACQRIKTAIPDFNMLFIGSGDDAYIVENAAKMYSWIYYFGPKFGKDRIPYFKLAAVQLMPGRVGLGILDSFALETPIVTTHFKFHSPEIEYLENGKNGIITRNSLIIYTEKVIQIL